MRLQGIEAMGYYPTPPDTLHALGLWLACEGRGRAFDPCCGEAEALAYLAQLPHLDLETYGVELSDERAKEASAVLDHFLGPCGWETTWVSQKAFTFVLLNPPYDWEGGDAGEKKDRLEWTFLRSTTPHVAPGGVLAYVIPQARLDGAIARHLAGFYEDLQVRRLPDGEYERFRQVVILAVKKRRREVDEEAKEYLLACREQGATLPALDQDVHTGRYVIPEAPQKQIKFFRTGLSDRELVQACIAADPFGSRAWQDLVAEPEDELAKLRPAMPLKTGHVAMLISAGLMGNLRLAGEDGSSTSLVSGRVTKRIETTVEEVEPGKTRTTNTEYFSTQVTTLTRSGEVEVIEEPSALEAFMKRHGAELGQLVTERFAPAYDFNPSDREWQTLAPLAPEKRLPGRDEAGLLPTQKHVAVSAARTVLREGAAIVCGEMGVGKTVMALAAIELLDAYPAIVVCPSHLVGKWVREAQDTTPGICAVEIACVGDVQRFAAAYRSGELPHRSIAIVSKEKAKLGPGWSPVVVVKQVPLMDGPLAVRGRDGRIVTRKRIFCPTCGAMQVDREELPYDDPRYFERRPRRCCACGVALYTMGEAAGSFASLGSGEVTADERRLRHGYRRYPIAGYVREKLPRFFALLIGDECHQFKGKSTDQGVAFHHLVDAARLGVLALTGTLFGGRSTSIFWLLHRMVGGVRRDFGFHDEIRWAERYGRLEKITTAVEAQEAGTWTGRTRHYDRTRELPGISPAIVSRLLDVTHFVQLTDLGYPLPPYEEEVVTLEMTEPMTCQYDDLDRVLRRKMRQARAEGDHGLVSVWLQTVLARPNSAFREEWVARYPGTEREEFVLDESLPPLVCPAEWTLEDHTRHWAPDPGQDVHLAEAGLPRLLPKEEWLSDFCRAEAGQGRKAPVYLRQTGTRDVRGRYRMVLEEAGLRVGVLPASVSPRKREQWLVGRLPGLDVLITNPKLVETGLDLYACATVVFAEIVYSLYTMWQACRRVWRLGQTKPVKVVFAAYAGVMEEAALGLMGEKMKAAQLLYGDEVSGALVETGDRDFLAQLAREVLAGETYDLQKLFAEQNVGTVSPLGSPPVVSKVEPTAESPRLTWSQYVKRYGPQVRRPRRRGPQPLPGQRALPGFGVAAVAA